MDRGRSMSKARRRRRGGIFIVKRARRMTPATSYSVLLSNPLDGIIRHFLQAASHSTDIKIQLLLEKKGRIPNGVSPIWSGQRLDDFQVEEEEDFASLLTTFFFLFLHFFFPPNNFAKTETIANCGSLLLIFPTNFVSRASFVFVSRVNSSPRWFIIIIIIIMIIASIRIISILHRCIVTIKRACFFLLFFFSYIYMYILSIEKVRY